MKYRITILLGLGLLGLILGRTLESETTPTAAPSLAISTTVRASSDLTIENPKAELERLDNLSQVESDLVYRSSGTKDWDEAKKHAHALREIRVRAVQIAQTMNSPKYQSQTLRRLSRAHYLCGDFQNAESSLLEALEMAPSAESKSYLRESLFDLYAQFERWDQAQAVLEQSEAQEKNSLKKQRLQLEQIKISVKSGRLTKVQEQLTNYIVHLESEDQRDHRILELLAKCWSIRNDLAWEQEDRELARLARINSLSYKLAAAKAKPLND